MGIFAVSCGIHQQKKLCSIEHFVNLPTPLSSALLIVLPTCAGSPTPLLIRPWPHPLRKSDMNPRMKMSSRDTRYHTIQTLVLNQTNFHDQKNRKEAFSSTYLRWAVEYPTKRLDFDPPCLNSTLNDNAHKF